MKQIAFLLFSLTCLAAWTPVSRPKTKHLFNGKNLKGWHADVPQMDTVKGLTSPFIVRNGLLVSLGKPFGHLVTDAIYKNYRLEVDYRFPASPGNSGVLVHVSTPRVIYGTFPRSIEAQLQYANAGDFYCLGEDITVPDMENRRGPKSQWGTTPDKKIRIRNLTDGSEKPPGEWNTLQIECLQHSIRIWVNGDLVNEGFNCTADKGRIALQSEGTEIEFRKIVLTPIPSD